MKMRSKTISYATKKKGLDKEKEKDLANSIQNLEARIVLTENNNVLYSSQQEIEAVVQS